ncbi:hypothetical protein WJX73_009278 [Symbiochloris irregularis]|uniref:Pseudouridine synthase RsuA/RluA-like domain-containing protein n=1 Tax=Symbiochloris irregularis TaxID=706552 RepID=A0AAW1PZD6_9CHLO
MLPVKLGPQQGGWLLGTSFHQCSTCRGSRGQLPLLGCVGEGHSSLMVPSSACSTSARGAILPPGARLLVPKGAVLAAPEQQSRATETATGIRMAAVAKQLRKCILHEDEELLVLNKPAGLPVQGGQNLPVSIDRVLATGFLSSASHKPRLVHRLDMATTGALAVAKTPDAAAWLSAAFSEPTAWLTGTDAPNGRREGPWVRKWYWAIVHHSFQGQAEGTVSLPLNNRTGQPAHAMTHWRLKGAAAGLAWLECEPVTGRKHQHAAALRNAGKHLQLHCCKRGTMFRALSFQ